MNKKKELLNIIKIIMEKQLFAVFSSSGPEGLHSVIVSFAVSEDLKELLFFTPRQTRKFKNILSDSRVALFVDNRSNEIIDIQRTIGIEVIGEASEAEDGSFSDCLNLYKKKYPEMSDFTTAETTAAIRVTIDRFEVVQHFQNITVLEPS